MSEATTEDLIRTLNENHEKVVKAATEREAKIAADFAEVKTRLGEVTSGLTEVEQKLARRAGGSGVEQKMTIGAAVAASDQFKSFVASGATGKVRITLDETKVVNNLTSATGSAGGLIPPDIRPDPVRLPQRKFVLRDPIAPGETSSNLVEYPQQTGRQLNAATVAEGTLKPQSDANFALVSAQVRTIAHWFRASRQALDDAPLLRSLIDGELRYGLNLVEEAQMLMGDGTGQNLLGIIPQATAFSPVFAVTGETALDRLLLGIAQVEQALYPCDAIVINPVDWRRMQLIKDAMGNYIAGGPFVSNVPVAWNLPLVTSMSITAGNFLVGAFHFGAQVFDRLLPEVVISTEDQDNFVKNLITVRGEERLAFAVKAPAAFVYGTLP